MPAARIIAYVLVLICVAAGLPLVLLGVVLAILAGVEHLRERRRHAHILAELGPPRSPFGAAPKEVVTIEGKLAAMGDDDGRIASFHPYGTSFLDEMNAYAVSWSTALAVDLDGNGRAILEGPAQVLRGAVETEHDARLDLASMLGAEPLARSKAKKRVGQFRVVQPGDRVRIRGAVEPAPDDNALYRAQGSVVRLTPGPTSGLGEAMIAVASLETRRRRLRRRVAPAVAAVVIGGGLAVLAIPLGMRRHEGPIPAVAPVTVGPPSCRIPALATLGRFQTPVGCDDPYALALTHYAAGEFTEASAAFAQAASKDPTLQPSLSEVETHLFVHRFDLAADTVRRMDARFYPGPSTPEKRSLECIRDILDERVKSNEHDHAPHFVKVCSLRPFAKTARVLDSNGQYDGEDDWPRPTFMHDTRYDAVGETFTSVVSTRARLTGRPIALERDLVDRLEVNKVTRYSGVYADELEPIVMTWAAEVALFYAYAGFPERAKPYWPILDRLVTMVEKGQTFFQPNSPSEVLKKMQEDETNLLVITLGVASAAALYANEPARLKRYTAVGEPYTSQAARQMARITAGEGWEAPVVDSTWPESKAVFDAKDGSEVVRVLIEQHSTGRNTLPREVPRLLDLAPLVKWFASDAYPAACVTCGASTYLGDLSDRREVARLLRDTKERDRLEKAAERFTTAYTDPIVGFELDELESFFGKRK